MIKYSYFSHPNSVCLSYFQHMKLSLTFSYLMLFGSCKALIHAFFPFFFITDTTDTTNHMKEILILSGCQ